MKHFATALLALAACTVDSPPPEGEQVTSFVEIKDVPLSFNSRTDVLFVIDSSPAMAAAQQKLIADYRAMIESLALSIDGTLPDIHIGVTTADAADQGRLRGGDFVADAPAFAWRREKNYDGSLADLFVDRANVGTGGHALVQPLDAVLRAISPTVNPGFIRDHAYLRIVILTAGDDQSATPVADVVRALKSLKTDPAKVAVSGAFGACASNGITATDAPRLAAFFDEFPYRNTRTTLCEDLTPLVELSFLSSYGLPCLEGNLAQPIDCNAWLEDPNSDETYQMPPCSAAHPDRCWELEYRPQYCGFGSGISVELRPRVVPFEAHFKLECVVDPS